MRERKTERHMYTGVEDASDGERKRARDKVRKEGPDTCVQIEIKANAANMIRASRTNT